MKKNIVLVILVGFLTFIGISNVYAKSNLYSCTYKSSTEDIKVEFKLRIKNSSISAETAKFSGKDQNDSMGEDVKNWSNTFFKNGSFKGSTYYDKNKKCPPYLILSDSNTGYNLFVSDEGSLDSIKNAIKDKYSTLKDGFPKVLDLKVEKEEEIIDEPTSCLDFNKEPNSSAQVGTAAFYSCENNPYFACIWNENEYGGYCNVDNLQYVQCGDAFDIPKQLPSLISLLVNLLKIATPIILIMISIITLFKAITASKEDEIKKAQSSLIKKIIAAVMVFFVISIVQFVVSKVADSADQGGLESCFSCFLNNDCSDSIYYKTNVGGVNICTYLDGSDAECGD